MKPCKSLLTIILLLTPVLAAAQQEMPQDLLDRIHAGSLDYHQKLRNYDLTVREVLHSKKRNVHQTSTKRIIEDSLGQLRVESDIEQFDEEGNIIASAKTIHVYNLQQETSSQKMNMGESTDIRTISIRQQNSMATVVQPKTFFTAGGRPFHELIDNLLARNITIYGSILDYPDYPGTLAELIYQEQVADGDIMRHRYLINLGRNFFPMRQETYFNGHRYLVLIPTPKELAPGIFFPVKCTKIAYDIEKEGKEVSSVTDMNIDKVELNTNILPKTFTFQYQNGDIITDHRTQPPSRHIYTPPELEKPSKV